MQNSEDEEEPRVSMIMKDVGDSEASSDEDAPVRSVCPFEQSVCRRKQSRSALLCRAPHSPQGKTLYWRRYSVLRTWHTLYATGVSSVPAVCLV